MNTWPDIIQRMEQTRVQLQAVDTDGLYTYLPPRPGCSKEEIAQVEARLGFPLDRQYAEFLQSADGWQQLYQSVDLFGTPELLSAEVMDYAKDLLKIVCQLAPDLEFTETELLPIGVARQDSDLFLMTTPVNGGNCMVLWFSGYEVERFDCFLSFITAIASYNKLDLEDLQQPSDL